MGRHRMRRIIGKGEESVSKVIKVLYLANREDNFFEP